MFQTIRRALCARFVYYSINLLLIDGVLAVHRWSSMRQCERTITLSVFREGKPLTYQTVSQFQPSLFFYRIFSIFEYAQLAILMCTKFFKKHRKLWIITPILGSATVAIVSWSSLLKVVCPPIRLGNRHFSLLRSVDRRIPKSRATLFSSSGTQCTARTASRTCSAVKRSRLCDIFREKK